jgi:glutamate-1-semialdehyde 2,1-aminomutase
MSQRRSHLNSDEIYRRACELLPGGANSSFRNFEPHLSIRKAEGALLVDSDGNEYIDYHAGFGPALLGHNHPGVRSAVIAALNNLLLPGVGVTELEVELARKIQRHVPCAERVLLCNSGSEATYHAIRAARAGTGRKLLIKFDGSYHGFHDYVLGKGGSAKDLATHGLAGSLPEAVAATLVCSYNNLDDVEDAFKGHRGAIAAILVEPIQHNAGCIMPKPGFLEGLRALSSAHGAALIFDEVVTGFRHHLGGYQAICGVTPDLTTLGKAMANGFPIAAVAGKREFMDCFAPGGGAFYAGTYNGNAVSTAAALATIEILECEPVHEQIFRQGERLREGLRKIHERLGVRATVAGFGSIFVTYFMEGPVENRADLERNDAARFVDFRKRLLDRGIFMFPANLKRNHVSYAHSDEHIARTLHACEDTLENL